MRRNQIYKDKFRIKEPGRHPAPSQYHVARHEAGKYRCECGAEVDTSKEICEGSYDQTIVRKVAYLSIEKNMTLGAVREYMDTMHGLDITEPTILAILERGKELLRPCAEGIRDEIMASESAGFDETGMSRDGIQMWVWIARAGVRMYMEILGGRGSKHLRILAGGYAGTVVSDGYRAYHNVFDTNDRQRCISHILRGSGELKEQNIEGAEKLHGELSEIIHDATVWSNGRHGRRVREEKAARCQRAVVRLAARYVAHGGRMEKFGGTLHTAAPNMFTFVRIPGVQPTNNLTEQAIRRPVLWRKVHGQLKSWGGAERLGILMTCFGTWRLMGLNPM